MKVFLIMLFSLNSLMIFSQSELNDVTLSGDWRLDSIFSNNEMLKVRPHYLNLYDTKNIFREGNESISLYSDYIESSQNDSGDFFWEIKNDTLNILSKSRLFKVNTRNVIKSYIVLMHTQSELKLLSIAKLSTLYLSRIKRDE